MVYAARRGLPNRGVSLACVAHHKHPPTCTHVLRGLAVRRKTPWLSAAVRQLAAATVTAPPRRLPEGVRFAVAAGRPQRGGSRRTRSDQHAAAHHAAGCTAAHHAAFSPDDSSSAAAASSLTWTSLCCNTNASAGVIFW